MADFIVFEHTEGFVDATFAAYVFWVEDVTSVFGGETVEMGKDGIELGLEQRTAVGIEYLRLLVAQLRKLSALIFSHFLPQLLCPTIKVVVEITEFGYSLYNLPLRGGWDLLGGEDGELFDIINACMSSSYLLS